MKGLDGEVDIATDLMDNNDAVTVLPSVESKNYNPAEYSDFLIESETDDLIDKFVTQAESDLDKDSFVLVTTPEYESRLSDLGQIQRLRGEVQSRTSSDVDIEITTYDELEN